MAVQMAVPGPIPLLLPLNEPGFIASGVGPPKQHGDYLVELCRGHQRASRDPAVGRVGSLQLFEGLI